MSDTGTDRRSMNTTVSRGREQRRFWSQRSLALTVLVAGSIGISGCSDLRSVFSNEKDPPDEFQVVARAPLSLPPNFDLRPPTPGIERPQEGQMADVAAERILGRRAARTQQPASAPTGTFGTSGFGGSGFGSSTFGSAPAPAAAPAPQVGVASSGANALRTQLGVDQADPNIRAVVNEETANFTYDTEYPIDRLLFWKPDPVPGIVVDAEEENRRLRENAALGQPLETGQTPTIERRRGGILDGIF